MNFFNYEIFVNYGNFFKITTKCSYVEDALSLPSSKMSIEICHIHNEAIFKLYPLTYEVCIIGGESRPHQGHMPPPPIHLEAGAVPPPPFQSHANVYHNSKSI